MNFRYPVTARRIDEEIELLYEIISLPPEIVGMIVSFYLQEYVINSLLHLRASAQDELDILENQYVQPHFLSLPMQKEDLLHQINGLQHISYSLYLIYKQLCLACDVEPYQLNDIIDTGNNYDYYMYSQPEWVFEYLQNIYQ